jgi:hypothetical protein
VFAPDQFSSIVLGLVASAVSLEVGGFGAGAGCAVAISELQPNNATEAALYHGMFNLFILKTPDSTGPFLHHFYFPWGTSDQSLPCAG